MASMVLSCLPTKGMTPQDRNNMMEILKNFNNKKTPLYVAKVKKLIESLTPCSPEELGSTDWLKKLNALMLIFHAVEMDIEEASPFFTNYVVDSKKIPVMVSDMVTIHFWLEDIRPQLLERAKKKKRIGTDGTLRLPFCNATSTLVYVHKHFCAFLIACAFMFNQPDPELEEDGDCGLGSQLGADTVVDIIEFMVGTLSKLIEKARLVKKFKLNPDWEEFHDLCSAASVGIKIIFHLAQTLDKLAPEAIAKMLHPHTKLYQIMATLILEQPWRESNIALADILDYEGKPKPDANVPWQHAFSSIGTNALQVFHVLFLVQITKVPSILQMTKLCHSKLVSLLAPLQDPRSQAFFDNEDHWTASSQGELEGFIKASVESPPEFVDPKQMASAPVSRCLAEIRAELEGKKEAIIDIHEAMETFETATPADVANRLNRSLACYINDINHQCFRCGKTESLLRCSRCHYAYYCNRKCQSKDWANHKPDCQPGQERPREAEMKFGP